MRVLLKAGRIVNPLTSFDGIADILIENGKIAKVEKNIIANADEVHDMSGKVITPGLVDMHVHLREPGLEAKEDIVSGTRAAANGGFTHIACMPNTKPVIDNAAVVNAVKYRAMNEGVVKVEVIGAISKNQAGLELAEIGDMILNGAVAVSDDGKYVQSAKLFKTALEYAAIFGRPVISHAEDSLLADEGYMHEGAVSAKLGLLGVPSVAEDIAVARDIMLAEYTNTQLHIAHVSTKGAVDIIRQAKKRGVKVTAEATVHHLTLTDKAVIGYNTAAKVNPPLRDDEHVAALIQGVQDGTIDAIVTDHAPHAFEEKDVEFRYAPCGFAGLETSVGVILTELYHTKKLSLQNIVNLMAVNPAKILGLPDKSIVPGVYADLTIIDTEAEWTVDSKKFYTKGKHTPYEGRTLKGKAVATIVNGKFVMKDGEIL